MIERVKELLAAGRRTRVGRALIRYGTARGALMAGGIAYTGMFSIFAVLVIGMNLLMAMLGTAPPSERPSSTRSTPCCPASSTPATARGWCP